MLNITRILNVSDAVYSIKVTVQFTDVFRTLSNISDGMFCKKNAGAQPEIVQGREGEGGGGRGGCGTRAFQ